MYYNNGETVTKDRIEEEDWYPEYQEFLEHICFAMLREDACDVNKVLESYYMSSDCVIRSSNKDRHLRWAVFHAERMRQFHAEEEENEK